MAEAIKLLITSMSRKNNFYACQNERKRINIFYENVLELDTQKNQFSRR